jgi:hypothetical protein
VKNTAVSLFAGSLALFLFLAGCNKTEDPTNTDTTTGATASFTLNGAGFSNRSFSFAGVVAAFSTTDNATVIIGTTVSDGDTTWLTIVFPGRSLGTFQFADSSGVIIMHGGTSAGRLFANGVGGGQIAVSAYGSVAGNVTGSFSGRLYEFSLTEPDSVTLSNGSFKALRVPDQ